MTLGSVCNWKASRDWDEWGLDPHRHPCYTTRMDHKDFESWQRRSHFDALDREGEDEIPHPDDREEADENNAEWRRWHK